MNYVVYDATGTILRSGQCPAEQAHLQAKAGEAVMEGEANDIEHAISGGKIRKRPKTEIAKAREAMQNDPIKRKMQEILHRQAVAELTQEQAEEIK